MKYAVIQVVNGSTSVVSEGWADLNKARVSYHNTCKNLYNDIANVKTMAVMIIDWVGNIIERDYYVAPESDEAPTE